MYTKHITSDSKKKWRREVKANGEEKRKRIIYLWEKRQVEKIKRENPKNGGGNVTEDKYREREREMKGKRGNWRWRNLSLYRV